MALSPYNSFVLLNILYIISETFLSIIIKENTFTIQGSNTVPEFCEEKGEAMV